MSSGLNWEAAEDLYIDLSCGYNDEDLPLLRSQARSIVEAALDGKAVWQQGDRTLREGGDHEHDKQCSPCPSCGCCGERYWTDACEVCINEECGCSYDRGNINRELDLRSYVQVYPEQIGGSPTDQ